MNEEWRNELVTKGAVFDAQEVYMAIRPLDGYEDGLAMLDILRNLPSAQPEQAIKDCRNCKFGDYNDHWNTNFCYYSGDCNNWDKWEPSAQSEIIRCKDCKYMIDIGDDLMCDNAKGWVVATTSDFGCVLAERRTE